MVSQRQTVTFMVRSQQFILYDQGYEQICAESVCRYLLMEAHKSGTFLYYCVTKVKVKVTW